MIKTVIFDVGNVLTDFGWQDFIKSFGYSEDVTARLGEVTIESRFWKEYDRGVMSNDEIVRSFISLAPDLEEEIRNINKCLTGILKPADYAIDWIKEQKAKGLQVLFLSNFSEKCFRECQDALGFLEYMDGGIFSYTVKLIKPEPEIYGRLLDTYGLKACECVFIDDLEANIKTAEELGFHTVLFKDHIQASEELDRLIAPVFRQ